MLRSIVLEIMVQSSIGAAVLMRLRDPYRDLDLHTSSTFFIMTYSTIGAFAGITSNKQQWKTASDGSMYWIVYSIP